ncbi:hypothetical protein GJ744_006486 [Endocarpon pusillum]|uniref:Uncharacterized protein n=1 Tax=Endocarpon pusillum TaxID=364733 RepID=A0A8H7AT59_9EURO|nr:hypothetical protein GJ744_006486 [Endocarpon pusillum]
MSTVTVTLSIVVYKGDPVDAMEYRHTALFAEFSDGTNTLLHITGESGFFAFDGRPNQVPVESQNFVKQIYVATIPGVTRDGFISTIRTIPIDNQNRSWNCPHWVGDALNHIAAAGMITQEVASKVVLDMVDIVFEAKDEA